MKIMGKKGGKCILLVMAFGFTLYCIVPLTVLFTGKLL